MPPEMRELDAERIGTVLVQILVPLQDGQGRPFPAEVFADLRAVLTHEFGGVTAYLHSPAKGDWVDPTGHVERDEMMLVEVMATDLDRQWWAAYRSSLESLFQQDRILVRAMHVDVL